MQKFNEDKPAELLLLAWNLFNITDAKSAKIVELSEEKLSLSIVKKDFFFRNVQITKDYDFTEHEKSHTIDDRLSELIWRAGFASWPPGGAPFISLILWMIGIVSSLDKSSIPSYFLIIREYSDKIVWNFPLIANRVLITVAFLHFLEVLYVLTLIRTLVLRLSRSNYSSYRSLQLLSWIGFTFVLGYPITERAMLLAKLNKKKV